MENILEGNYNIFLGFYTALARTKSSAQSVYLKVLEAQRQFFINFSSLHFSEEQILTIELLDDALTKFYLGSYTLEQLWGVHNYLEIADHGMPKSYNTNLTDQQNEIVFLLSSLLDQALYSWRSFLDFYLKYLLYVCTGEFIVNMSLKDFRKIIEYKISSSPDDQVTYEIMKYIKSNVLCESFGGEKQQWGDLLKSLRDKTTHQKLIKPSLKIKENKQGYIITWPTIGGKNYSEMAQWHFENNAFEMLRQFHPILYGFKWLPGPYKPGMFAS